MMLTMEKMEKIVIIFMLCIIAFFGGVVVGDRQAERYFQTEIDKLEEGEAYLVGRLHALHGIYESEKHNGKYYYYRNGKKCRL